MTSLEQVLIVLSGLGLVGLYLNNRRAKRAEAEYRAALVNKSIARIKEIDELTKKLREDILIKKEKFNEGVKKFNSGSSSSKSDGGSSDT